MLRGSAAVVAGVVVVVVVGALLLAGPVGALSALAGGAVAWALSLFTLWLITRTAETAPSAVMLASFGGLLLKIIVLLVVLVLVARLDDVHRESLAVAMAAVFVVAAAAQARAGARMRTLTVIPESSADNAPTSGTGERDLSGPSVDVRIGAAERGLGGRADGDVQ
ncbi:ATP synthase subunit I [Pseudonocardia sichuanensis]